MLSVVVGIAVAILTAVYFFKFFRPPSSPSSSWSSLSSVASPKPFRRSSSAVLSPAASATAPKMSIFFGSQSGTAETFANELAEEGRMYGFAVKVVDLEDYDKDELKDEKYAVFLMATFGEGEPTDNAIDFIEWLKSSDRQIGDDVRGVPFAVFGLGNRQYEHFCAIGKYVDARLGELGGNRVVDHGEGDDDGSLEEDFSAWKKDFWAASNKHFGLANDFDSKANETKKFISSYSIIMVEGEAKYNGGLSNLVTDPKHRVVKAKCVVNNELRQYTEDGGSTRHIEFDLAGLKLSYVTADNLGIYPRNPIALAEKMCQSLKLNPNQLFKTKAKPGKKSPFPSPCSILDAFAWYLDIQSSPRLPLLSVLAQYTTDEKEKATLQSWGHEQKDEYVADHKSWIEIFDQFKTCRPPLADLLDFIPKMMPRYYTISSSSLVSPQLCSITVSLMIHHRPRGRVTLGIASLYLKELEAGKDLAAVFIRPSTFRFPKPKLAPVTPAAADAPPTPSSSLSPLSPTSPSSAHFHSVQPPIVMIGPGTGLAPFRGFVQEISHLKGKGVPVGDSWLFYGCRDPSKDYIYSNELKNAESSSHISRLLVAFSRLSGKPKVYVQNLMEEHSADLWRKINEEKGYIFICGGTAMGRAIREAIVGIGQKHGGLSQQAAEDFIKKMQAEKRFVQELWS